MTDHSTPIPPWAFPGNKVVCVGAPIGIGHPNEIQPEIGQVYTIRKVVSTAMYGSAAGLLLQEIVNPLLPYATAFSECDFRIERFKPVATTDNEIEAQIYNRNSPRKSLSKKLTSA